MPNNSIIRNGSKPFKVSEDFKSVWACGVRDATQRHTAWVNTEQLFDFAFCYHFYWSILHRFGIYTTSGFATKMSLFVLIKNQYKWIRVFYGVLKTDKKRPYSNSGNVTAVSIHFRNQVNDWLVISRHMPNKILEIKTRQNIRRKKNTQKINTLSFANSIGLLIVDRWRENQSSDVMLVFWSDWYATTNAPPPFYQIQIQCAAIDFIIWHCFNQLTHTLSKLNLQTHDYHMSTPWPIFISK